MTLDERSLLLLAEGAASLDALEAELAPRGLTLGVALDREVGALTVAEWIARGMPGAPSTFADPADHVLAGLVGTVGGKTLEIRPGPRRAVGPDLVALFTGTGDRLGRVTRAWLRVHRRDVARPSLPLPDVDLDPAPSEAELRLVEALAREIAK